MVNMLNILNNAPHFFLWNSFMILSNVNGWWLSSFFKPLQKSSAVSAIKVLFSSSDPETNAFIRTYGIDTKLALEVAGITECFYKNNNSTMSCVATVSIKYSSALACEALAIGTAAPYIVKPACFAIGTLLGDVSKVVLNNLTFQYIDSAAYTSIATTTRFAEHWLPSLSESYGISMGYAFYITSAIEGGISLLYKTLSSTKITEKSIPSQKGIQTLINNSLEAYTNICENKITVEQQPNETDTCPFVNVQKYDTNAVSEHFKNLKLSLELESNILFGVHTFTNFKGFEYTNFIPNDFIA